MKKILSFYWAIYLTLACLFLSPQVFATDRYVSDVVYIALRSDKNPESSIVQRSIVSGTKLTFLREETGTDNNLWSLVISPEGNEGWVRSFNISAEPTAAMKLANLPNEVQDSAKIIAENRLFKEQLEKL